MECQGAVEAQQALGAEASLGACSLPLTLDELASSILCWGIVLVCHG